MKVEVKTFSHNDYSEVDGLWASKLSKAESLGRNVYKLGVRAKENRKSQFW